MKKTIKYMAVFIAAVLVICCLSACGAGGSGTANGGNGTADDKASESVDSEAETAGNDNVQADTGTGESGAVDAVGSGDDAAVDSAAAEKSAAGAAESAKKSGKGVSAAGDTSKADGEPLQIVTTIFPEYDWVKNVLGGNPANAEVTLLLDNGVDLHSYQPTAEDILKISTCDLFVYVGGESDEWVEDALKEAVNPDMQVINLLEVLGDSVRVEEIVEGMQAEEHDHEHDHEDESAEEDHTGEMAEEDHTGEAAEEDHTDEISENQIGEAVEDQTGGSVEEDHEHEGEEHNHEEGEVEYDEHVWLSLRNSQVLTAAIAEAIEIADPENAEYYKENTDAYLAKMSELDEAYKEAVAGGDVSTLLFGDRFPFRYLADDYGLDYYAAFVGCSAETEASFETITFLSQKMDELGLPAILTIEGKDHRIAETVLQNTKSGVTKILTMDSMQSTTSEDIANGADYLKIMTQNLAVLKEALTK